MKIKKILSSKIALLLLILVVSIIGFAEIRQLKQRQAINNEIATLKAQEQEYSQKTQELENSLNALNMPEYKEKLARRQLNLKKDGEIVVNYPQNLAQPSNSDQNKQTTNPNYLKWWNYFFSNK